MLIALNETMERVLADASQRGGNYFCPVCAQKLVLKKGTIKVPHFAHKPPTDCWLAKEGESARHLEAKVQLAKLFPGAELEVICGLEHRADLIVKNLWVIECQVSAISIEEWRKRTRDYSEMGYIVLWVWDLARIVGQNKQNLSARELQDLNNSFRIPAEIRRCHDASGERTYVLTPDGRLAALHLREETYSNEWVDEYGEPHISYGTYISKKHLSFHRAEGILRGVFDKKEQITLARFSEKDWWRK